MKNRVGVINLIMFLLLQVVIQNEVHAQEAWRLVKDKNGIQVYVASVRGSKYVAFKAIMSVQASQATVIKLLKDVENYPNWFAFTASAKLIDLEANELTFFMETDYPWPYANEGMNYQMKFEEKRIGNLKIRITGSNRNMFIKNMLKMARGYILLENFGESILITYMFHCEPSQKIPAWLVNASIDEMPYKTFSAMRNILSK
ncbi:SRPBCC family protein [Flavicella marina]|uniref:hypothetical protein n=1 Tax=Flavicella marina TaxID=1475951 RepID=UPI001264F1E9|nr:hypothetical protein [Flavicella marina]